jgi:signal transduction histidine kinase
LGVAGLWATVVASDQIEFANFIWSGGLIAATPWFAGRVSRSRRQRIASLELEQEQRTQIALADERARIARELHDVVAHSVGVIVVQAQGARRMIHRDPARADEALATIEDTARSALGEMRRSLGVLRSEGEQAARAPQPGVGDIEGLLANARSSGLSVDFTVEGTARPLPQGVDLSAYRIVQEALTNTIKHAGRVRSRVTLRYGDDELVVEVKDDGPGPAADAREGAGHGLVGMRERVAALAGELHAGAGADGGFMVRASLPLDR